MQLGGEPSKKMKQALTNKFEAEQKKKRIIGNIIDSLEEAGEGIILGTLCGAIDSLYSQAIVAPMGMYVTGIFNGVKISKRESTSENITKNVIGSAIYGGLSVCSYTLARYLFSHK